MKEILDNWEQWQNEEFERSMEYMMETEDQCQIFCPVCERSVLSLQENIISCGCGLR
jgi:ATP-dependent protease HslVU (ClpYQ) peptidase subunit